MQLEKVYEPSAVEDKIYKKWEDGHYFHAVVDPAKRPYSIVIPPPNITGQLHMGHALDETLQDIIIRTRRMQGYSALWLPGTDHASIATEAKIVEKLRQEGTSKEALGRDQFLVRAWQWKEQYGSRIVTQLKKLGSSCDWDRLRFTMDEGCNKAVVEVFCRLYEEGSIYQGERIINWCPHCNTSISDAEVEFEEQEGSFWHIRYPLKDGNGWLEIATTRPETLLGDTAVAVNPDDERYKDMVGKLLVLPLVGREIPIIADEYVDREFGTGAVKITPAHDPNDFEVGRRHALPAVNILNGDATINENGGRYAGMDRYEARRAIVADLEAGGYLVGIEPHVHNVGTCYRCGTTVEPWLSKQWFVRMKPLAEPAIEAVRSGKIKFVPARMEKIYYNWMENIRDWCISRQLWWGHRIPAYYCDDCGEMVVSRTAPACCPKCGKPMRQDEDTLDTWFSSALWPFSTLGWPDKTPELDYFYPTNTLVTGYDIIFFWVARMIFSGLRHMGDIPFETVFFHGLVRDAQGRKMSKSLGNGIDPLDIIDTYGADALRFTLVSGVSPGNDMRFSEEKVRSYRNFCNKIWNAARFVLMNGVDDVVPGSLPAELMVEEKWVLSRFNDLVAQVSENFEKFELGVAAQKIYDFTWDIFCDWYIELAKLRLNSGDEKQAQGARQVLVYVLTGILKLLHPYMPYITEEIYDALPHDCESIMISRYPEAGEDLDFRQEENDFSRVMDLIRAIRVMRADMNVPPAQKTEIIVETPFAELFGSCAEFIRRLASGSQVRVVERYDAEGCAQAVSASARALIPMDQLVDKDKERARLQKELEAAEKEIAALSARLSNENFVSRAPEKVVNGEREKLARAEERKRMIETGLASLG
mgnify:FL=1